VIGAALISALVLLLLISARADATVLPATISEDTTLTASGGPYTGLPTIKAGVTLTVEPGTKLEVWEMIVEGTLLAEGTAEEPIRFTGPNEAKWAEWHDISFGPESRGSVLDHVEIADGGSNGYYSQPTVHINGSSPKITNSIFRMDSIGITVPEGGAPEIAHNRFIETAEPFNYESKGSQSGKILFHDNRVEPGSLCNCGAIRISQYGPSLGAGTLSGNIIEYGSISYGGDDVPGDITQNILSGGTGNHIYAGGTVSHSETWANAGETFAFSGKIAAGVTLRIEPGLHIVPTQEFEVEGTLLAEGTAEEPIRFTGPNEAKWAEWHDISFGPESSGSVLDHVEIADGGSNGFYSQPTVHINGSSPKITNSIFRMDSGGITVPEGGAPEFAHDTFIETGEPLTYESKGTQSGKILFHDNRVELESSCSCGAIRISQYGPSLGAGTLSGNTIEYGSISYGGDDVPGDITQNTFVGGTGNHLYAGGTVSHSETWANAGETLAFSGKIAAGVTLRIEPGLHIVPTQEFEVEGTLLAEGSAEEPILFTGSRQEESHEWRQMVFGPGSSESVLRYVEIADGGSNGIYGEPTVEIHDSSPTIEDSTFRKDTIFSVTGPGKPIIEYNRFRDAGGLFYEGSGVLNAPNNDWGCDGSPRPAGCGAEFRKVEWKPAACLLELDGHLRGQRNQGGESADPVVMSTGALNYSHVDLSLPSNGGEPLSFTRTYSSDSAADKGLGTGWSQTGLATATELASGDVLVVQTDGRQDLFSDSGTGYVAPSGVTDVLSKSEGKFQLTSLQGSVTRFDASGRIASVTDSHGLATTYVYGPEDRLSSITDSSGQSLFFSYDSSNHITAVKDSTGREVRYGYSAAEELETITDPLGGVTRYSYEGHRLKTITDPRGNVILKNLYDGQGRISEQEDGTGGVWELSYAPGQTTVTEPGGGEEVYGFDGQGRVVSETNALGHTTTLSYDGRGEIESVDRPGGADWHLGHDAAGNLISIEDPQGDESSWIYEGHNHPTEYTDPDGHVWTYEWSAAGNLEKEVDPEGGETLYGYDAAGNPTVLTDPDGHTTEIGYGPLGERVSLKDSEGNETTWGYDARGYLISSTQPGLNAEAFERDALGDLLSRTTPEGYTTDYEYDLDGLLIKTTDPGGHAWKIERNAMERPIAYEDPLGHRSLVEWTGDLKQATVTNRDGAATHYRYDAADQLTEEEGPEGETFRFGYNARGDRTSSTDPRGHTTDYRYDLAGRLLATEAPLGSVAEYGYDPDGRMTSWVDPDGRTTELSYDERGLLTAVERPLGQTTAYEYDADGLLTAKITAEASLEYSHDEIGRLTGISDEGEALRSLSYAPDGRLSDAGLAGGPTISVGWTEDGLLSSVEDGRGQAVEREYDSRGQLTKETGATGAVEYAWDAAGRMESLTDPQGRTTHFEYDDEGAPTAVERPGGVDTTNAYDEAGRLAETTTQSEGATLESLAYEYDADGDPISVTDRSNAETTYGYDALDRLTEWNPPGAGATSYGYDPAGNRTHAGSTTYSFNALNELTTDSNGASYSYDADGRLASVEEAGETTSYSWDHLDKLTSVESPGGTSSFTYDALGRLATRASGGSTRSLHYGDLGDYPDLATEGEASLEMIQGAGGLLAETVEAESASWPLLDGHGDVVATASSSAEAIARSSYGPWGELLEGAPSELGFIGGYGRVADPVSGLVQMGARTYAPGLGAFLSRDPVLGHPLDPVTLNPFAYVGDEPLGRYDLDGREFLSDPWGTVKGAVEGGAKYVWSLGEKDPSAEADEVAGSVATVASSTWEAGMRENRQGAELITDGAQDVANKALRPAWSEIVNGWDKANAFVLCVGKGLRHPTTQYECLPSVGPHKITPETFYESPPGNLPPSGPRAIPVAP
jgi:RHS repeat-associated protein